MFELNGKTQMEVPVEIFNSDEHRHHVHNSNCVEQTLKLLSLEPHFHEFSPGIPGPFAMDTLIALMNHPYLTMKLGLGSDKRNIDAIYPISLFFAFGIYLVVDRYQKRYNSAVPFGWTHPDVRFHRFCGWNLAQVQKAADPNWHDTIQLTDPSIEAHLTNPDLLPYITQEEDRYITSFDPSTGLHLGTFIADDEVRIQGKIERAQRAQQTWKATTFQQRRRVIRSLLKWLVDNQEVCARVACRDTGKTCKWLFRMCEKCSLCCSD